MLVCFISQLPKDARYLVSCEDRENTHHKLTIINVSKSDMATYSCVIAFEDGNLITTSTSLEVSGLFLLYIISLSK